MITMMNCMTTQQIMGQSATKVANAVGVPLPWSSPPSAYDSHRASLRGCLATDATMIASIPTDIIALIVDYTITCISREYIMMHTTLTNEHFPSGEGTCVWALPIHHVYHMLSQPLPPSASTLVPTPTPMVTGGARVTPWISGGNRALAVPEGSQYFVDTMNDRVIFAGMIDALMPSLYM